MYSGVFILKLLVFKHMYVFLLAQEGQGSPTSPFMIHYYNILSFRFASFGSRLYAP